MREKEAKGYLVNSLQKSKEGKLDEALELIQKAIDLFPDATVFWTFKAEYFYEMEKYPKALECVNKAIDLKPKNFHAWSLKGSINKASFEYHKAAEAYARSLEIKPDFNIYTLLASVQYEFDLRAAVESAKKALELNPDWEEAKNILKNANKEIENNQAPP